MIVVIVVAVAAGKPEKACAPTRVSMYLQYEKYGHDDLVPHVAVTQFLLCSNVLSLLLPLPLALLPLPLPLPLPLL